MVIFSYGINYNYIINLTYYNNNVLMLVRAFRQRNFFRTRFFGTFLKNTIISQQIKAYSTLLPQKCKYVIIFFQQIFTMITISC